MKNIFYITLILFTFFLLSCNSSNDELKGQNTIKNNDLSKASLINGKIIIILDNYEISNLDFKNYLRSKYSDLKSIFSENNLMSRLFDSFIDYSIILKSCENESINITEKEILDYSGNKNLQINNTTRETIINHLKIEKFLYTKIYKNISVSEYEIQKYYKLNKKDFFQNDKVELYQILLKTRKEAIEIRGNLLLNPSEFTGIAKSSSISPESAKDGYMGIFEKGELPKDVENVVFSLPSNQLSRVVESQFGFHIFKVKKKIRRKQQYLKNVNDKIKNIIFNTKMSDEFSRYLKILKKNINMKIICDKLFFNYSKIKGE